MDNIKFRGKRITGSGFIFGNVIFDKSRKVFINDSKAYKNNIDVDVVNIYEVVSQTVGQFTGLKDKFDNEIYVGDLMNPISENITYEVVFENGMFGLKNEFGFWGSLDKFITVCKDHNWEYSVSGNIYEN